MQKYYEEAMALYNQMLIAALKAHWELKRVLNSYTAAERYQWFLDKYPGLIDKVSNKYIASFLGMTPVTLSRLRRMLREKNGLQRNNHLISNKGQEAEYETNEKNNIHAACGSNAVYELSCFIKCSTC